jgi:hypothetical protein
VANYDLHTFQDSAHEERQLYVEQVRPTRRRNRTSDSALRRYSQSQTMKLGPTS